MKQPKSNLGNIINNSKSRQLSDSQQYFMLGIFGVGIIEFEIKYRKGHSYQFWILDLIKSLFLIWYYLVCPKQISVNPGNSCVKLQMQILIWGKFALTHLNYRFFCKNCS
ncbi:hypothetical protein LC607_04050 [Nostoc sp. CHAB 5824]|nr:hypothetical protein [Nostoc sp. CHAB 5824]